MHPLYTSKQLEKYCQNVLSKHTDMYTIKKAIVSSVKQLSWKAVDFISTTTPLFNKGF